MVLPGISNIPNCKKQLMRTMRRQIKYAVAIQYRGSSTARRYLFALLLLMGWYASYAQYSPVSPRSTEAHEIPIDKPGYYGEEGATYVLTKDITSTKSGIFLGKDVTLDLNGYTLTF